MATGGCSLSLAALKRKLDNLAKQIFEIDLKIQQFKEQEKDIADLQEAKTNPATGHCVNTNPV